MSSSVQDFYEDRSVFITGGTGFVGKVLIEKLLRSCRVSKILVLVRPKRGKTTEERFEKLLSYPCFDLLKSKNFDFKSKIELIPGDCAEENLGLSENDRNYLIENVDIVVHSAADVKFDRSLRHAAYSNVRAIRDLLEMAKNMKKLKSLVHVSTAFTSVHQKHIKDEFYEPGMSAEELLTLVEVLDEETLKILTPRLISKWQNTYVYTKAIAEDLIRREGKNLPLAVVRPSQRSAQEPMAGWCDNFYGFIGFLTGIYLGLIRVVMLDLDKSTESAPVDYVCNLILAVGWKTHQDAEWTSQAQVYNFAGSNDHIETWRQAIEELDLYLAECPTTKSVWTPTYILTKQRFVYTILSFLLHTLPSYIIDLLLAVIRKKPMAIKGYQKFHHLAELTVYFRVNRWTWDDGMWKGLWKSMSENDKRIFNFNFDALNWREYERNCCIGARAYLVKDPIDTLDAAKKKSKVLKGIHYFVIAMLVYGFCKFLHYVLYKRLF